MCVGSAAGVKNALVAVIYMPGMPIIYYGTEMGMLGQRDIAWSSFWGSKQYNEQNHLYVFIKQLIRHRKPNHVPLNTTYYPPGR